ncbi:MAG: hypothetical protein JWO85_1176 [Candidatus Eremiobacteraeota bacterium]|nr:hypothetical protein [Candidatus Eremiobacteraeota bacterium]
MQSRTARLAIGTLGAIAGALLGALVWAGVSSATGYQIGYMAVLVGYLSGYGMRTLGGGRDRADGFVAGAVALAGCVLGNLLTVAADVANHLHKPLEPLVLRLLTSPGVSFALLQSGFGIMDVLFYAIAAYAGYRTAFKAGAERAAPAPVQPAPEAQ